MWSLALLLLVSVGSFVSNGTPVNRRRQVRDVSDLATADLHPIVRCPKNDDHLLRRRRVARQTAVNDEVLESNERNCYFRHTKTLRCNVTTPLKSYVESYQWRRLDESTGSWLTVGREDHLVVDVAMQGHLQCLVFSSVGVVMSNIIHVQRAVLLTNYTETSLQFHRGQLAAIPCSYHSIPRHTTRWLTWQQNGEDVDITQRDWIQLENGTLLIPNISDAEAGTYRCTVGNWILYSEATAADTHVSLDAGGLQGAGVALLHHSQFVSAIAVGDSVTLTCVFENRTAVDSHSWTLADVRWSVGTRSIDSSSGVQLVLSRVQLSDAGDYVCAGRYVTAAGAHQQIKGIIPLAVEDIPRITRPLANQKAAQGGHVTFTCNATGHPQPMVTWFINAELLTVNSGNLPEDDVSWIMSSGGLGDSGSLTLRRVNVGGLIVSCNASNQHGYQLNNAYAEWVPWLPSSPESEPTPFPVTYDVTEPSTPPLTSPLKTTSVTPSSTVPSTTTSKPSTSRGTSPSLWKIGDPGRPEPELSSTTDHVLVTSSTSTTLPMIGGLPFYIIIVVGLIAAVTAVLTTAILVVCYKRCRRKPREDDKQTKQAAQQRQQLNQAQVQRQISRSSSADSGIDDINAIESDEFKKPLNVIEEERSIKDDFVDEEEDV